MTWLRSWGVRVREALASGRLLVIPSTLPDPRDDADELTKALLEQASKPIEAT